MVESLLAVTAVAIREERPEDHAVANRMIGRAFASVRHSQGRETLLADALRDAGGVTLGLVAEAGEAVVGHLLASPVTLDGAPSRWQALGPVAVEPDAQGRGIGTALLRGALERLRAKEVAGVVVLGNPVFYGRFGFRPAPDLVPPGLPARFFQIMPFDGDPPRGRIRYHPAFDVL